LFLDGGRTARKLDAATPEPGYANFGGPGFLPSGALGGWSVGNTPRPLPNGMGRYLKKGSDLVVQMHYHPTGKPETDQSELGLFFVKKPVAESLREPASLVGSIWVANYEMDIPADARDYRRTASYTLPKEVIMVGVVPHMHLLGKSMKVTAVLPDRSEKTLIDVPNWNYNWQDEYYFERPFKLPAGTRLDVSAAFDNSSDNPSNPSSPPRRVTWGDGTKDEMLFCFFLLSAERTEDLIHVVFDNLAHDGKQPRKAIEGIEKP
ncbi:MAG TPA: alkyl hydroperoxide reductase, partial [Pirellulales bacterium]